MSTSLGVVEKRLGECIDGGARAPFERENEVAKRRLYLNKEQSNQLDELLVFLLLSFLRRQQSPALL